MSWMWKKYTTYYDKSPLGNNQFKTKENTRDIVYSLVLN